ncbi:zinc finger matrin-type protein 5 isoform X1 [Mirounga angustirostris]|uniref:zinc finger matrin-type protein 5 isoform X1 n=2 Tax=Mirounga angustirostris TaxID=9716 RepID=UPI00313CCE0A
MIPKGFWEGQADTQGRTTNPSKQFATRERRRRRSSEPSGPAEPDAAAILLDEQNKRPCRKFLLTGQCDFGSNCRFSHMSERDLQELSIQVEEERRAREWPLDVVELPEGHLEDWLEKRAKRLSSAPSSRHSLSGLPAPGLALAPGGQMDITPNPWSLPCESSSPIGETQALGAEPMRTTIFQYPIGWPPVQELPPSLRAPPPGGWPLQPSVQWG